MRGGRAAVAVDMIVDVARPVVPATPPAPAPPVAKSSTPPAMDSFEFVSATVRVPGPGSAVVPLTVPATNGVENISLNRYAG